MITVYTMTFNEELLLPFMIGHYRTRFPGCRIVVHDNESTDKTVRTARKLGCEVKLYRTAGQVDDQKLREFKNSCWKEAKTDWVLVCDPDELLDIGRKALTTEQSKGTSIISSEAYTLVNMRDNSSLSKMKHGFRDPLYDKAYLFNRKMISEIGYEHGAHVCSPEGDVKWSERCYRAYHYKYVSSEIHIRKNRYTVERMSNLNKQNGWGAVQWHEADDQQVRQMFAELRGRATRVVLAGSPRLRLASPVSGSCLTTATQQAKTG